MTDDLTRRLADHGDQPEPLFDPQPEPWWLAEHRDYVACQVCGHPIDLATAENQGAVHDGCDRDETGATT